MTQEVIDYREWIIKKWGGRDLARTDNRGVISYTLIYNFTVMKKNCLNPRLYEEYRTVYFILIRENDYLTKQVGVGAVH